MEINDTFSELVKDLRGNYDPANDPDDDFYEFEQAAMTEEEFEDDRMYPGEENTFWGADYQG